MKRILAIALCLVMALAIVACGGAKEAEYKLGMGVVVNTNSSKTGNAQVDATIAAVVTDADGKIVACRIDVAQNKMNVTDGAVELDKTFKTKMELGDDYNMAKYGAPNVEGGTVKEWYVQTKAFEQYVIGKTAAEVEAIKLQEVNKNISLPKRKGFALLVQLTIKCALVYADCGSSLLNSESLILDRIFQ